MSTAVAVAVGKEPSRSPAAILVRKLFRRKVVLAGAGILVVVALLALFAPWVTPYEPMTMKIADRMQSPRLSHWFGTDELGRDVFSRVVFGARYSLTIGALVVLISVTGGVLLGLVAGFFRRLDGPIMRVVDAMMSFPDILLAIALVAVLGASMADVGHDDRQRPAVRASGDLARRVPGHRDHPLRAVAADGGRRLPRPARSKAAEGAVTMTSFPRAAGRLLQVKHLRTQFFTDAGVV